MNSTLNAKLEALRAELLKGSGDAIAEVSAKTIAGWHADKAKADADKTNTKARQHLRDAEKHLKATIASLNDLKRAEPGLKDIIETYAVAHLEDWISGQHQGSMRMLWRQLRDIETDGADSGED